MVMQITRRNALLGASAAALAAVAGAGVPTPALAIKAALAGDPVIGLSDQLRAASKAWFSAIDAFEDATHRVGYLVHESLAAFQLWP